MPQDTILDFLVALEATLRQCRIAGNKTVTGEIESLQLVIMLWSEMVEIEDLPDNEEIGVFLAYDLEIDDMVLYIYDNCTYAINIENSMPY